MVALVVDLFVDGCGGGVSERHHRFGVEAVEVGQPDDVNRVRGPRFCVLEAVNRRGVHSRVTLHHVSDTVCAVAVDAQRVSVSRTHQVEGPLDLLRDVEDTDAAFNISVLGDGAQANGEATRPKVHGRVVDVLGDVDGRDPSVDHVDDEGA